MILKASIYKMIFIYNNRRIVVFNKIHLEVCEMKKLIALVLSIVMVCCFSVTAFAADSPSATEKVTFTVRKADVVDPAGKVDTEYTLDAGTTITVKANSKYGTFKDWSIYKETTATGVSAPVNNGIMTLSAVKTLAATKFVDAVAGTDYEIVKGSLTTDELTIKVNASVVICANYDNVKTDPALPSSGDNSSDSPATGDMTAVYVMVVMLAVAVFAAFNAVFALLFAVVAKEEAVFAVFCADCAVVNALLAVWLAVVIASEKLFAVFKAVVAFVLAV